MDQYHEQASAQGVPCALQHYLFFYGKHALSGLSKDECVIAFQFWVTNFRADMFNSSTKEPFMCPMLWCRDTFKNQSETIDHVSQCHWLLNTWYWCPDCSRPETYMDCGGTGGQAPQRPLQRRESKLRRAVTFFKHFGRKGCVKGKITWPTFSGKAREMADTSRHAHDDEKYSMMKDRPAEIDADAEVFEMARRTAYYPTPLPELPSHISYDVQGESPLQDDKHPFEATTPTEMFTRLSHTVQHELPQPAHSLELPGDLLHSMASEPIGVRSRSPLAVAILPLNEAPIRSFASQSSEIESVLVDGQISSFTDTSPRGLESIESVINRSSPPDERHYFSLYGDFQLNPTSSDYTAAETPYHIPGIGSSMAFDNLPPTTYRANTNIDARPAKSRPICWLPEDRHQLREAIVTSAHPMVWEPNATSAREQPFGNLPMSCLSRDSVSLSDGDLASMEPLIQELRELVFIVNQEWLERLSSCPDLLVHCSTPSGRTLFELGINALKMCYNGTLVNTFFDVFALMHLACASAYILHRDDDSYCWDGLLQDMLDWQHAILKETDLLLFVRVMDKLSSPRGSFMMPSYDNDFSTGPVRSNLLENLKTGRVVNDFAMLLADLDYSRVLERNNYLLPEHLASYTEMYTANLRQMINQITKPLQRKKGIEAFQKIVVDTEFRLRSGMLRDPWEVEVTLLSSGREYSQSRQVYQRYQEAVACLCDKAMGQPDPAWRDRYYATTLDLSLGKSFEMDKRQRSGGTVSPLSNHGPSISVLDVVRSNQDTGNSPTVMTSIEADDSANVSPISTTSASTMQSSGTSAHDSILTSPTAYTESMSSGSSSPSSPVQKQEARCHLCGKPFAGISCTTNLQRHMRFTKIHNNVAAFECPKPGCGAKFLRSDNRNQHFSTAHPLMSPGLRRKGTSKRSRGPEDEDGYEAVVAEFV